MRLQDCGKVLQFLRRERKNEVGKSSPKGIGLKQRRWGWGFTRPENTSEIQTPLTHRVFVELMKCKSSCTPASTPPSQPRISPLSWTDNPFPARETPLLLGAPVPLSPTPAAPGPTRSRAQALVLTQPCIKPQ